LEDRRQVGARAASREETYLAAEGIAVRLGDHETDGMLAAPEVPLGRPGKVSEQARPVFRPGNDPFAFIQPHRRALPSAQGSRGNQTGGAARAGRRTAPSRSTAS